MSVAAMVAALAAAVAAAAIVELAAAGRSPRPPRRRRRRAPRHAAALLASVGRRVAAPAPPSAARALLAAAGVRSTESELVAARWGTALAALLAAAGPASVVGGHGALGVLAAAGGAGFLTPGWVLRRRVATRRAAMLAELPAVLDLVAVAADAGMAPLRALGEAGRRGHGPLAGELRAAATRGALGEPHPDVLAGLLLRCPAPGVDALVAAVGRTERHGVALGPAVRALAVDARARAAQQLRDRAARAAPKIQLVVALLLVPSVLLLVAATLLPRP